jgi:hypothetical protein
VAGGAVAAPRLRRLVQSTELPLDVAAVVVSVAGVALLGVVGADARWLAALGEEIERHWRIPQGVPFAALPTGAWHNVPVLGEVLFNALERLGGDRALLAAQLAAVAAALSIVRADMRAGGADEQQAALVLPLLMVAAAPAFLVVRAQLFSLALFPAVLALLRSDARRPSRRVWLVPPLLALWANLHGAVLVGLLAVGCHLVCVRLRRTPRQAIALGLTAASALLATPALLETPAYFRAVLGNEAARRGVGLWAPLSLRSVWGILLAGGAVLLLGLVLRSRPRPFDLLLFGVLAMLTVQTARSGVWLTMAAAVPAAHGIRAGSGGRSRIGWPLASAAAVAIGIGLVSGPHQISAAPGTIGRTLALAHGRPVLAEDALAEQVALAGGRIWIGNPIDAFSPVAQRPYVAWLRGEPAGDPLLARAGVVLVRRDGKAERRLLRLGTFSRAFEDDRAAVYIRH